MKIPTEEQLAKRVAKWQKRLALAGIAHWELAELAIVSRDEMPNGPAIATAFISNDYDLFRLWFAYEALEEMESQEELDRTVVHELVHVAMRGFDLAVSSADREFSRSAGIEWDIRVTHERERFVDGIARAFVDAWGR